MTSYPHIFCSLPSDIDNQSCQSGNQGEHSDPNIDGRGQQVKVKTMKISNGGEMDFRKNLDQQKFRVLFASRKCAKMLLYFVEMQFMEVELLWSI